MMTTAWRAHDGTIITTVGGAASEMRPTTTSNLRRVAPPRHSSDHKKEKNESRNTAGSLREWRLAREQSDQERQARLL